MSAHVIRFAHLSRRQRGHFDIHFVSLILGGGAIALGVGLIALGLWLVWCGTGVLGWRG